jgi:hypothetical protein
MGPGRPHRRPTATPALYQHSAAPDVERAVGSSVAIDHRSFRAITPLLGKGKPDRVNARAHPGPA